MRRQAPEAEDPCLRALPCSTWLAGARGAHTSRCPLLQLISCPLHPHLLSLGGEGSLSLRFAEIESSWIGPVVWLGLSCRFSCLCVFTQKREPRPLGWGQAGPSPFPTQVVLVRPTSQEGHQLHPRTVELAYVRVTVNDKLALISRWCQWGNFNNFSICTVNPRV